MKSQNNNQTKSISLKNEKFAKQLAKVGVQEEKELTVTLLVTLMGNIIDDFTEGGVTMQELSTMFSALWEEFYFHRSEEEKDTFSEIIDILRYAKEIDYYTHDLDPYFFTCLQAILKFHNLKKTIQENVMKIEKKKINL